MDVTGSPRPNDWTRWMREIIRSAARWKRALNKCRCIAPACRAIGISLRWQQSGICAIPGLGIQAVVDDRRLHMG